MGKGKTCVVSYGELYHSMGRTVLMTIEQICDTYSLSYEELKQKLPDEIANHGDQFTQEPVVVKKESELKESEKKPKARFFYKEPIYLEKDGFNIVVSNQWTKDNFKEFCDTVEKEFGIEIERLDAEGEKI